MGRLREVPVTASTPAGAAIPVLRGKGGRTRTAGIDPGRATFIEAWLTRRRTLDLPRTAPLISTLSRPDPGGPLSAAYARAALARYAARAGIEKPARVYSQPAQLKLHTLAALCTALQCSPNDLIEVDTTPVRDTNERQPDDACFTRLPLRGPRPGRGQSPPAPLHPAQPPRRRS